jgi:hypothetical protein
MNIDYRKSTPWGFHIISGSSPYAFFTVLRAGKFHLGARSFLKIAASLFIILLSTPIMAIEKLWLYRKIARAKVEKPVFILGYPRSGTTFLMYVMSKDPQFTFCRMYHCMGPHVIFLFGQFLRRIALSVLPKKRPMDNLDLGPDLPKEEEFALANYGEESMANALYFPRHFSRFFDKYVLFNGSVKHKKRFLKNMDRLFKKITALSNGKRLLLKSPFNTGRINTILELYPDARFIHIHRDPIEVYFSNVKLYESVLPEVSFHDISGSDMENHLIYTYQESMKRLIQAKKTLRPEQYYEVEYSSFVNDPVKHLGQAYQQLQISGFEQALPFFTDELGRYTEYKRNAHKIDSDKAFRVNENWRKTYQELIR